MNRADFFAELLRGLRGLPQEEIDSAKRYYTEYFDEAGPENEHRVLDELGDPAQAAAQIRADYLQKNPGAVIPKERRFSPWWILLAIFLSPIVLPLVIVAIALVFAVCVTAIALILPFGLVFVILSVVGVCLVVSSFTLIPFSLLGTFFVFGTGIALVGVGLLLGAGTYLFARLLVTAGSAIMRSFSGRAERRNAL